MSSPAGWYPDPDPDARPGSSRYWDGSAWTAHVRVEQGAPGPQAPARQGNPYQQGNPYHRADPYQQGFGYPAAPAAGAYGPSGKWTHNPAGRPLSGWGRRLAAYLLDGVVLFVASLVVAGPWWSQITSTYGDFFRESLDAAETGATPPSQTDLMAALAGPMLAVSLISLLLTFAYQVGFWKWRGATPGKMALGIRIVPWASGEDLPWGMVLKRWLAVNAGALFSLVPYVGALGGFWPLLDGLWPLWDDRRQALHDKFAGTSVVRTR